MSRLPLYKYLKAEISNEMFRNFSLWSSRFECLTNNTLVSSYTWEQICFLSLTGVCYRLIYNRFPTQQIFRENKTFSGYYIGRDCHATFICSSNSPFFRTCAPSSLLILWNQLILKNIFLFEKPRDIFGGQISIKLLN